MAGKPGQTCVYGQNKKKHGKVLRVLVTKEMLIKSMRNSKCLQQPKDGEINQRTACAVEMKRPEPQYRWDHGKMVHPLQKSVCPLCNMLNIESSQDSECPLLGIQGTERKVNVHNRNAYANMHSSMHYSR